MYKNTMKNDVKETIYNKDKIYIKKKYFPMNTFNSVYTNNDR